MVNDVRRAYFYAKTHRDIYIELPAEDLEQLLLCCGHELGGEGCGSFLLQDRSCWPLLWVQCEKSVG